MMLDGEMEVKRENDGDFEEMKVYPAPLHSHGEVVMDRALFLDSLQSLHSSLGTRFMIPVLGGKELDLHHLYVLVTQRGGLVKVTEDKKWKEVIAAFKFPPTTTSASFVLRRYYLSLLHHYEQVYFFNSKGPLIAPSALSLTKSSSSKLEDRPVVSDSTTQNPGARKRALHNVPQNKGLGNFTVTGSIDGKFEHGYLVTVKIGPETLRGVLYHVNQPSEPPSEASAPQSPSNLSNTPNGAISEMKLKRKKTHKLRDPGHPKPNRSAYNFFAEMHSKLQALYPEKERELSRMISDSWNRLTQEEKRVYQEFGREDKERYMRELEEYNGKLNAVEAKEVSNAESSRI